jgi:decaprenyl-phosphate phosphoribosyltransferase
LALAIQLPDDPDNDSVLNLLNSDYPQKVIRDAIKALRPKQWVKNLLVLAAPVASGLFIEEIQKSLLGVLGFIFASSIGYLVNDWMDRKRDALHPVKKDRPFASERLKLPHLLLMLTMLIAGTSWICLILPSNYTFMILLYLFITLSYTIYVKELAVTEIVWLALGFLVRAVAGSAIIEEAPTGWFVLSVFFGAIYIATTKRIAESRSNHAHNTRKVLSNYNLNFLNVILTVSISITLLTYALWVFAVHGDSSVVQLTIIPFTLIVLLYAYRAETGNAETPEELVMKDPILLLGALATFVPLVIVFSK